MNPPVALEHGDRRCVVWFVDHAVEVDLALAAEPFEVGEPFVALIWDAIGSSVEEERLGLGQKLVAAGCRYVVCGGKDCERWHDDADAAFLELPEAEREARFLMSSWHTGESIEEVVWFAFDCTSFEDLTFRKWLVALRGGDEELREQLVMAIRREIERDEDEDDE